MRSPVVVPLAVMVLGSISACTPPQPSQQLETGLLPGVTWVARLTPTVATGTRIAGDVRITPSPAKANHSRVVIELTGGAISNRHPWVISSGSCTESLTIELGGRAMYPTVELRTDGVGKLTVDLPVLVPVTERYHVSIFASNVDRDLVVACGELRPTT